MKKILTSFALVVASLAFAQVGVNNDNPEATLDIKVKDTSATATDVEGVLVPRVTATRAQNMGESVPESTLVYITEGTAVASTTISEVDGKGFYYFDAAKKKWVKIGGGNSSSTWGNTKANIRTQQLPMTAGNWKSDDFTVIVKGTGSIELPSASANSGRVISVRNGEGTNRTYQTNIPVNNGYIGGNRGQIIQSDGVSWWVIGGF